MNLVIKFMIWNFKNMKLTPTPIGAFCSVPIQAAFTPTPTHTPKICLVDLQNCKSWVILIRQLFGNSPVYACKYLPALNMHLLSPLYDCLHPLRCKSSNDSDKNKT